VDSFLLLGWLACLGYDWVIPTQEVARHLTQQRLLSNQDLPTRTDSKAVTGTTYIKQISAGVRSFAGPIATPINGGSNGAIIAYGKTSGCTGATDSKQALTRSGGLAAPIVQAVGGGPDGPVIGCAKAGGSGWAVDPLQVIV
jgi:hypothetical protein